ncbi:hypothetical protein JYT44_03620 [Caldithrix abyssi]|nr:hypothetical protein [Caldithrix abyssi]
MQETRSLIIIGVKKTTQEISRKVSLFDEILDNDAAKRLSPAIKTMISELPQPYGEALLLT